MRMYVMLILAVLLNALIWRLSGDVLSSSLWGFTASSILIICAICYRKHEKWRSACGLLYIAALALTIAPTIPEVWPCELTCGAGAAYTHIFGVSVLILGGISYAVCAICAFLPAAKNVFFLVSAAVTGCSLYFLALSISLDMVCPNCLSIHACILAACCLQLHRVHIHSGEKISWRIASAALAALALFSLYALRSPLLIEHVPGTATDTPTDTQNLTNSFADILQQQRLLNTSDAEYVIHCFIRINCSHCSAAMPAIIADITTVNEKFNCAIQIHFLVDNTSQAQIDQAQLALATCLDDQQQLALLALMGTEADDIDSAALLSDLDLPVESYQTAILTYQTLFNQLLIDSQKKFASSRAAKITPLFILEKRDTPAPLREWNGKQGWPAVIHQLSQYIPTSSTGTAE